MDKSWMDISDRRQPVYINGVNSFLDFAFTHSARGNTIRCPCYRCGNNNFHTREIVFVHLILNGIIKTYRWWSSHGEDYYNISPTAGRNDDVFREEEEEISEHDDMHDLLHDFNSGFNNMNEIGEERDHEDPNETARKFYDLLSDAEQELYPGCKEFSKFQFMVTLLALKSDYGWTDRSFTELLKVLKRAIPCSEKLPSSFYEANNYIQELGMECKKIDACLNDCILYRDKFADLEICPTCGMSRWQSSKINNNAESNMLSRKSKNIPNKILRHFPLIPRLQRLYMCSRTAEDMRWHKEKRRDDGYLRHPADAFAWKSFDEKHSEFSSDTRNVRLGLAPEEQDELPLYVRLWEKTHKGKHNEWQDETVEELYKKLLEFHDTQMREKGEDKLTPEEAYTTVFGHRSGYILGMGPGPRPSERKHTNMQQLRAEIREELAVEMNTRIQDMEAEMKTRIQELESRMAQQMESRMAQQMESQFLAFLKQREPQADSTNES